MDYEKKNKDAISTIKQALRQLATNGVPVGNLIEAIKDIEEKYAESEDERIMENIIATIHLYYGEPLEDEAKEMIAWLKSLKERYTWKPSDEQMGALNLAIGEANSVDTAAGYEIAEILTSLYEQLKKLKA